MKIGDFAKACGTKISVLHHYDKIGLLRPIYTDRFTEYRYYDKSQIAVFKRISELKSVGFSLAQIKSMLYSEEKTDRLFSAKKAEYEQKLRELDKLKEKLSGGIIMKQTFKHLIEDINLPFENDERAVGKWQTIGKTDDSDHYPTLILGDGDGYLYFLPGGKPYWCYRWTKGKLIFNNGDCRFTNDYRIEQRGDDLYMIVDFKSLDYPETGDTTSVALRKIDSKKYTIDQISKKDNINMPFVNDSRVIGKWRAFCYIDSVDIKKSDFVPLKNPPKDAWNYERPFFFKEIEFREGGHCRAEYRNGEDIIEGDDLHTWTKGYWLRKWNSTACTYEIKVFDGKEYLIIEWKSGDYTWGGRATSYYVMVRE